VRMIEIRFQQVIRICGQAHGKINGQKLPPR
jgi:hypothetical protein